MTPDEHTIQETFIEVGDGHSLYVQEWGNAAAKTTVVHLHGGPGGGTDNRHKATYDPATHRVIFFDQRGAGKSLPTGSLVHNTTDDLIGDITKITDHFKLKSFVFVGGSWGSCLALAYGLKHPERVEAMVLNGIFTGSKPEIAWLDQGMFRIFMPDVWERYLQATPEKHRDKPTDYHLKRILGNNPDDQKRSAYTYNQLEGSIVRLDDRLMPTDYETYDPAGTTIEAHYMAHGCFMPNNYLLDNASKLEMPIWLVQGRYDMVCPPQTAYSLSKSLPNGQLIWTTSGHLAERESWNVIRTILLQVAG